MENINNSATRSFHPGRLAVAGIWAGLIGILSLLPGQAIPPLPPFPGADKLAHAGFYLPLGFLLAWSKVSPSRQALVLIALAAALYGYGLEIGQLYVPGRFYDLVDALANAAGACLGTGAYALWFIRRESPQR